MNVVVAVFFFFVCLLVAEPREVCLRHPACEQALLCDEQALLWDKRREPRWDARAKRVPRAERKRRMTIPPATQAKT